MEFASGKAIYKQIGEIIMEEILERKMNAGDKIPSVREMAVLTETNPNTVARTYSWMQDIGIIFNKRGKGYFLCDDAFFKVFEYKKQEFTRNILPEVFKTMKLLDIDMNELNKLYDLYLKEVKNA